MTKFFAELRKTSQTKRVSQDNEYQVVLITDDASVLDLGKESPDTLFVVDIKPAKQHDVAFGMGGKKIQFGAYSMGNGKKRKKKKHAKSRG